jgi:hypothetical protein
MNVRDVAQGVHICAERKRVSKGHPLTHIAECDHLGSDNWHEWKEWMGCIFTNCDITKYVMGTIAWPLQHFDSEGAANWDRNDAWAQQVIISNVTSSQMNHISSKETAEAMYSALADTHDNKAVGNRLVHQD